MPSLEILSGHLSGRVYTFTDEAKVGKDESCVVRINDPGVSRFHARLYREGSDMQIEDLGSSNGTYVNFKKRAQNEKTPLCDKDVVFFGRTVTKYWSDAPPERAEGVSLDLLRSTVPFKGLACPRCDHDLEAELGQRVREQEQLEVIRRLKLHELDARALEALVARARS